MLQNMLSKFRIKKPVEVDMDEIKVIPKNNIVDIGYLSPCFGIILYNSNEKKSMCRTFSKS